MPANNLPTVSSGGQGASESFPHSYRGTIVQEGTHRTVRRNFPPQLCKGLGRGNLHFVNKCGEKIRNAVLFLVDGEAGVELLCRAECACGTFFDRNCGGNNSIRLDPSVGGLFAGSAPTATRFCFTPPPPAASAAYIRQPCLTVGGFFVDCKAFWCVFDASQPCRVMRQP